MSVRGRDNHSVWHGGKRKRAYFQTFVGGGKGLIANKLSMDFGEGNILWTEPPQSFQSKTALLGPS